MRAPLRRRLVKPRGTPAEVTLRSPTRPGRRDDVRGGRWPGGRAWRFWRGAGGIRGRCLLLALPALGHGATLSGEVTRVVDGDTVKVRSRGFETTVRLIGIDTPETRDPSQPVQCFGPEASARAKRLLPTGRRVRLVTDDTQDARDPTGASWPTSTRPGRRGPPAP